MQIFYFLDFIIQVTASRKASRVITKKVTIYNRIIVTSLTC
jgi:hypothetical protein